MQGCSGGQLEINKQRGFSLTLMLSFGLAVLWQWTDNGHAKFN